MSVATQSDRAASRAVLIGVDNYTEGAGLARLPAVERNIVALRELLCDDDVWGLAERDCTVLGAEADHRAVMRAIDGAARQATDTLLIYYAGHGLLHPERPTELHLALHDSNDHQMWRSLPYASIRDEVRSAHRRRGLKCAVVLDCCFSGAAVEGGMVGSGTLLQRVSDIDGVCVLTSSAATELAFSPAEQELSAFTGALVDVLRAGLPEAGPVLDFGTLHSWLQKELSVRDQPQHPQIGAHNAGERIALFRNLAFASHGPRHGGEHRPDFPAPPERLFGRDREVAELAVAAAGGPGALVVHGPPGVGKSALVAEVHRRLTDGRGDGSASEDDLAASGVAALPVSVTTPIVLLDDATDEAEVARVVAAAPDSLVLVTSRSALTGVSARRYPLSPLDAQHAVAMLRGLSGIDDLGRLAGHEAELAEIARLLGCLPLALRLIAARLRRTPTDVLLDVMQESDRLFQHFPSDDEQVHAAFTFSYGALTAPQKQLLHGCAAHTGPDFDRHSAAAVVRMPPGICGLTLEQLVDEGLLLRTGDRYTFPRLYRDYAHQAEGERDKAAQARARRRARLYPHLRGALRDARTRKAVPGTWWTTVSAELRAAAQAAREDGWHLATELTCEIAEALGQAGQIPEAREEAGAASLHATSRHDGRAMARARSCLALLGEPEDSWRPPEAGPAATRKGPDEELRAAARAAHASSRDPAERGSRLMRLAERAMAVGLVEESLEFQGEALTCLEETDEAALLAECLVGQAALHIYVGRYSQASQLAGRAVELLNDRGDWEGAAHAHATAAEALRRSGDLDEAALHARRAFERFASLDDPATLAYALRLAAKVAWAQGDRTMAHRMMRQAQEVHHLSQAEEGPSTRVIAHPSGRRRPGHAGADQPTVVIGAFGELEEA